MRKKLAITTLLIMFFNLLFSSFNIAEVYALSPSIFNITIQEEVSVVNGNKETKYQVVFNGIFLNNVDVIIVSTTPDGSNPIKTLEKFDLDGTTNLIYAPQDDGQTLQSIFGTTGDIYFGVVKKDGTIEYSNKVFNIPHESLMKVDEINGFSPASWPVNVVIGENFTVEGGGFHTDYLLGITTGSTVANPIPYDIVYVDGAPKQVVVDTETLAITSGYNQNLIFEKKVGDVSIRYIVRRAINVANPLNIGEGTIISPLQGTEGTIVRIKPEQNNHQLLDLGTKVYIGGLEARRNINEFSDGTFKYVEGGVTKTGLEVVVPRHTSVGPKPISIRNFQGDAYHHGSPFEYVNATGAVLEVFDIDPAVAKTNEEKEIDNLRIRNVFSINNLEGIGLGNIPSGQAPVKGDASNLKYFKNLDSKSFYIQYPMGNDHFVERKIDVSIGLKAMIRDVDLSADASQLTTVKITTDRVSQAGKYTVTARTETVYYRIESDGKITELQYIVEQAPLNHHQRVEFEFEPDTTTPIINAITPEKGPFNQNISATLIGSQFRVESSGTDRHYPKVIIGSTSVAGEFKYKVITRTPTGEIDAYFAANPDGTGRDGANIIDTTGYTFVVLDAANNVVDGQGRKSGNRIKFTIPAGHQFYNGFADVTVYNSTHTGQPGGRDIKANFFEYITPEDGEVIQPRIDTVIPDKVAVGKNEPVRIEGRNFQPNAIVTVDGEVIENRVINVNQQPNTITFNAPNGRVGQTKVQIINPDGGFASANFEYIQTYSQPFIERIIPNTGGKGSLVIIKGHGFFAADPEETTEDRKIGTKVYIDGRDINKEYFRESEDPDAQLDLREFANYFDGQPIFGPHLDANGDPTPIFTYGSNVAVVDNNTIYVIIPDPLDPEKEFKRNEFLNVRVVNPDLGSHQVNNGFKFIDVATKPEIFNITPTLGDYRGGNIVEINGENFQQGVKVFFGTQEAEVYRRSNNARTIWVYVPAYGGALQMKNRALVPVTVMNPNGSSFTKYDGYTYVNPGYDAIISKLTPNTGNTSGGDRIFITGINFRASVENNAISEKPAVYFGGVRVPDEYITFVLPPKDTFNHPEETNMIIVERTPPNPVGKVDVTVINFDGATANFKGGFEYRSKQPAITQVLPNQGSLLGGSEITIIGKDFVSNGLHIQFGNQVGKADILSGQAEVKVGDILVRYNAYAPENITLFYKEALPENELDVYLDGEKLNSFYIVEEEEFKIVRVPWKELPAHLADENTVNMADENIKIEIKDDDLIVTRRLGVIKKVEGEERIILETPPAQAVGPVQLRVFNYDGKFATSGFTYTNPFRPPVITKITPASTMEVNEINGTTYSPPISIDVATAPPPGGSPLIIEGHNFRSGVKVFIGDIEAEIRTKSPNDDEMIIIVPEAAANAIGPYLRILVLNDDGGYTYGDVVPENQSRNPYWFRYIAEGSFPKIDHVYPDYGPVTGGAKITIRGTGFKDEDTFGSPKDVSVLIGGVPVPQENIKYINPQTIEVITPAGRVGKQTIEVINYDQGRAIGTDIFTYISQPTISTVNPGKLFTNDIDTEVVISGKMFMNGAKVFIGGELMLEKNVQPGQTILARGIRGVTDEGESRWMVIVGGMEAASVAFEDENILKVKFNEAVDLTNNNLIVVNPDGGLSSEYKDFEYMIPIPTRPLVLEAIPGAESTVTLIWSGSAPDVLNRADRYEIYGKKQSDKEYTFIGDTRDLEFLVKDLELSTQYSFMVRAMNKYGSAIEFAEVKVRTFNEREDQQLREKLEELEKEENKLKKEGKVEIIKDEVIRTIGTEEIPNGVAPYLIDFSLVDYKNQNIYTVAIPVSVVQNLNRKITITDGKMQFTFLPRDLYTREVSQVSITDMDDSFVLVTINRLTGEAVEPLQTAIGRAQRRASDIYELGFQLRVGRDTSDINSMVRSGEFSIKFDSMAYPLVNEDKLYIGEYSTSNHNFTKVADGTSASIRNKGRYMLMANR
ncbi:IPT/TIG domain-containing protein [Alkaliphilus peptidifermentans]|uniref:IPT/TIG domain-containing protein n=1 Tax=Alkaliphilus peptidifermentans DSM 18978 TaxID=1120976 RepID=A0A1G5AJ56_9FIRM|nr:IPT/TIG domain-containing protein [Alkaliphilus peptidifermentans]SCX77882.1 IPT/TIG domain-containing protein [Alkaliphilus peptidifermentans DSM 18978]